MGWCTWHLELFLICIYKGKRDGVVVSYLEKVEKMLDILAWLLFFLWTLLNCREHEHSPNNIEDAYCQRILKASKEVPYIDLGESMTEEEMELEASTPEDGAEGEGDFLHIAQQERTFSEEDMARLQDVKLKEVRVTIHSPEGPPSNGREGRPIPFVDEGDNGRVVYTEPEGDNTCVDV